MSRAILGRCYDKFDEEIVTDLVRSQEMLLENLPNYLEANDHYNFTHDSDFMSLLKQMLSLDSS